MTVYTAYHGSNRAFDKPSDFSKLKNLDFGPGFYFALDPHDASSYGSYLYKAEVRVDRPIVISPDEIDQNFVRRFAKALGADDDDIRIGTEGGAHPIEALFELARTLVQVETLSPVSLRKFLIKLGYDGVLVDPRVPSGAMQRHGASTRLRGGYVVAFSPEQILSWERSAPMRQNPPPPVPWGGRHLMSWIQRTYAVGTPVRYGWNEPVTWSNEIIPAGARGVVTGHYFDLDALDNLNSAMILVEITDARRPDGSVINELIGRATKVDGAHFHTTSQDLLHWLPPLVDNWATSPAPIKRHSLPFSQKRTSRKLRPNTIPPVPPSWDVGYLPWFDKTFAPGTRVRILPAAVAHSYADGGTFHVPPRSIGKILYRSPSGRWQGDKGGLEVEVTVSRPLFTSSVNETGSFGIQLDGVADLLEPLDDNWGPLVISPKRHSPPPTRGWQKQLSASRSLRASRVKPNRRTSRKRTSRRTR